MVKEKTKTYLFKVIIEPDEDRWVAYCPILQDKGGATWGYTKEEALKNIRKVIQMTVESIIEHREEIPEKPLRSPTKIGGGIMYQKTNSYFSEVNILKELPKEISTDKFEGFLQQITEDFPVEKFPEIFVQYYKNGEKVIILGIGESAKCAKQTIQSLEKILSLRGKQLQLKVLRIPKTRFLLRACVRSIDLPDYERNKGI